MIEILRIDQWLYATLSGDVTLMALVSGVHNALASQGAALPYVVFNIQGERCLMAVVCEGQYPPTSWS